MLRTCTIMRVCVLRAPRYMFRLYLSLFCVPVCCVNYIYVYTYSYQVVVQLAQDPAQMQYLAQHVFSSLPPPTPKDLGLYIPEDKLQQRRWCVFFHLGRLRRVYVRLYLLPVTLLPILHMMCNILYVAQHSALWLFKSKLVVHLGTLCCIFLLSIAGIIWSDMINHSISLCCAIVFFNMLLKYLAHNVQDYFAHLYYVAQVVSCT